MALLPIWLLSLLLTMAILLQPFPRIVFPRDWSLMWPMVLLPAPSYMPIPVVAIGDFCVAVKIAP